MSAEILDTTGGILTVRIAGTLTHPELRAVQQQQLSVHAARLALLRVQSEQLVQHVNLHLALGGASSHRPYRKPA